MRGPLARKSVARGKRKGRRGRDAPNEVAHGQPRGQPADAGARARRRPARRCRRRAARWPGATPQPTPRRPQRVAAKPAPSRRAQVNDLLPFLTFVEHHPPGSSVNAIVETYSSHGAYVRDRRCAGYVPLRLMADPAPRSAREFMKIGESITLVVESFAPARRSIDLAIPTMATAKLPAAEAGQADEEGPPADGGAVAERPAKRTRKSAPAIDDVVTVVTAPEGVAAVEAAAPRRRSRKAAARGRSRHRTPVVEAPPAAEPASPKPARRSAKRAAARDGGRAGRARRPSRGSGPPRRPRPWSWSRSARRGAAAPAKRTRKKAAAPTT